MKLNDKKALITGGSSGTGKAISIALYREGCDVIFTYSSNEDAAKDTRREIGSKAKMIQADFRDASSVKKSLIMLQSSLVHSIFWLTTQV